MSFFEKLFKSSNTLKTTSKDKALHEQKVVLSLDDLFVNNYLNKGGKFLYCLKLKEVTDIIKNICIENQWNELSCKNNSLISFCNQSQITTTSSLNRAPFFTTCEHIVADSGNIMFSSNQLSDFKLNDLDENFIVFAKTSQLVKNMGEGLTGIKSHNKHRIPTNICAVNSYNTTKQDDSFLHYGNSNAKNMYLILLEDL